MDSATVGMLVGGNVLGMLVVGGAVSVAALTALRWLCDKGQIQPEQQVVIHGASGGVGTFAVKIAKAFGADVTAVCSTPHVDLACSLGADHVIDYARENVARSSKIYDVIFDVIGKSPFSRSLRSLTPSRRYPLGNPRLSQRVRAPWSSLRASKSVIPRPARSASESTADFHFLKRAD
jgi:D-arabinose 1-dehydrogenase-like Zn-dependent alcohol dehydrogenase